jgi:hypothetical protein
MGSERVVAIRERKGNRMLDRILGRRNAPANGERATWHRPRAVEFPEGVTCGAGCGRTVGNRCSYRDMTGRRCGYWCEEHSVFMKGRVWCQRHANSIKWIRARDGSIYEIGPQAAIDDRSPNLVGTLVDELNAEVIAHLSESFRQHKGVHIVTDAHIRTAAIPKGRVEHTPTGPIVLNEGSTTAWERGWGVYSQVGYLARVILRVTATEPPVVHVIVNGMLVLRRVPDWITNRGKGGDQGRDHASFNAAVLESIREQPIVQDKDPQ